MAGLIVEEKIGLECLEKRAFFQPAQKHGLVDRNAPVHQGADGAFMRRGAAGGDQRRAQAYGYLLAAHVLQALQGLQQGFERAWGQGARGVGALVLLKFIQAVGVVHALGLVGEEHGIAVESNAQFVGMAVGVDMRVGKHLRGRKARLQRLAHIAGIG